MSDGLWKSLEANAGIKHLLWSDVLRTFVALTQSEVTKQIHFFAQALTGKYVRAHLQFH